MTSVKTNIGMNAWTQGVLDSLLFKSKKVTFWVIGIIQEFSYNTEDHLVTYRYLFRTSLSFLAWHAHELKIDYTHSPRKGVNELKCPHCQAENRESAKFCVQCAQPLTTTIKCPKCGHINPQGSRYCEECASLLVEQTIQSEPSKPTTTEPTSFVDDRYQVIRNSVKVVKRRSTLFTIPDLIGM